MAPGAGIIAARMSDDSQFTLLGLSRTIAMAFGLLLLAGQHLEGQSRQATWYAAVTADGNVIPFTVVMNGKAWKGWPDLNTHIDNFPELSRIPEAWKPRGVEVPLVWRAYLIDRPPTTLTARRLGRSYSYGVAFATDLPVGKDASENGVMTLGVATNGTQHVEIFRPVSKRLASRVRSTLARRILELESAALAEGRGRDRDVFGRITNAERRSATLETETLSSAVDPNGTTWIYFEGAKRYTKPGACPHTRFVAVVTLDRGGQLQIKWSEAYAVCELWVSAQPLGIVRAGSKTCWLVQRTYEDGRDYVLASPADHIVGETATDCLPPVE